MLELVKKIESLKFIHYLFGAIVRVAAVLTQFFLTVFVTRTLSINDTGTFFLALGALTILAAIMSFGMEHFLIIKIASHSIKHYHKRVKIFLKFVFPIIILAVAASLILVIFYETLSIKFSNIFHVDMPNILFALGAISGITILSGCINGLGKVNVSIVLTKMFVPVLLILYLAINEITDLKSVALAFSTIAWLTFGITFVCFLKLTYSKSLINIAKASINRDNQPLNTIGVITLSIIGITAQLFIWSGPMCAGLFMTASEVATIHVVQRSALLITFALITINAIDAPRFARAYAGNDQKYLRERARLSAKVSSIFGVIIGIVVIIFAKDILSLFGGEYRENQILVLILGSAQIFSCICGPVNILLMMTGNKKLSAISGVVSVILIFSLSFFLTPILGLKAIIISMAFGVMFRNILDTFFVKRKLGFYVHWN